MNEHSHALPTPPAGEAPAPHLRQRPGVIRYWLGRLWPMVLLVLLKGKTILALVLKGKLLGPLVTSFVSIWAYSLLWGWQFAALFVAQLFVHEMGHVFELKRQGIKASAPMFIPFLGALIAMKEMPHDARREAQMAIAGPIAGGLAAAALAWVGFTTGSDLLLAAAYTGFFLNLFNLVPLTPLDGGRISAALHPAIWAVGIALMLGAVYLTHSLFILLIALIGGMDAWHRWRARREEGGGDYYTVTPRARWTIAIAYAGLALALVWGMQVTYVDVSGR